MRTLSEEQFKKQYGAKGVAQLEEIDNARFGVSTMPSTAKKPAVNRFTEMIGLGGATDVFGSLIARTGLGDATREEAQEFVEAPTGKQIAGAVAQTATIPAGAVLTGGGSLAGQMAAGAGLGYIYDVGADFAAGVESAEAFKPGVETLAGAAIPPVLRGAGAGVRGVGTVASRSAEAVKTGVGEIAGKIPTTGLGQRARELAQRFPRAVRKAGEFVDEGAEIAARRETGTPQVVSALDEGVPLETIDFVQEFDIPTRSSAKEMLDLAEGGRGADLPQTIPGKLAGDQLGLVETQRKDIGKQIGAFSDSLPAEKVDVLPSLRDLRIVLDQNGVRPFADGIRFENFSVTNKQKKVIQEMYDLATQADQMSPKQIHQMDQLFSKLQREARFDGVDDVFIEVPTGDGTTQTNIYKVFRDVFSQKLDEVAEQAGRADIKELNREYRTLRNLQDNVESTIVRQSRLEGVNVDPAESASVALRRLFGQAQSRGEYQEVYDQLDAVSRSLGYEGARADTLMDFYLTDVKPLYPETVPKASFEGGIRGALSGVIDKVTQAGAPDVVDKRKALRGLLELTD